MSDFLWTYSDSSLKIIIISSFTHPRVLNHSILKNVAIQNVVLEPIGFHCTDTKWMKHSSRFGTTLMRVNDCNKVSNRKLLQQGEKTKQNASNQIDINILNKYLSKVRRKNTPLLFETLWKC